jgi:pimeloyl-ACP methyl ester carboxylesterase
MTPDACEAVPALVVEGDKAHVPLDATEAWAEVSSNARLFLIRNAGRMNWIEQPDIFFPAIGRFLHGNWPSSAKHVVPK